MRPAHHHEVRWVGAPVWVPADEGMGNHQRWSSTALEQLWQQHLPLDELAHGGWQNPLSRVLLRVKQTKATQ